MPPLRRSCFTARALGKCCEGFCEATLRCAAVAGLICFNAILKNTVIIHVDFNMMKQFHRERSNTEAYSGWLDSKENKYVSGFRVVVELFRCIVVSVASDSGYIAFALEVIVHLNLRCQRFPWRWCVPLNWCQIAGWRFSRSFH